MMKTLERRPEPKLPTIKPTRLGVDEEQLGKLMLAQAKREGQRPRLPEMNVVNSITGGIRHKGRTTNVLAAFKDICAEGGVATVREVAKRLGVPPQALSGNIKTLLRNKCIRVERYIKPFRHKIPVYQYLQDIPTNRRFGK